MPEITHVNIPVNLVNAMLANLGKQPLAEVVDLFLGIKQSAEASLASQEAIASAADGAPGKQS